MEAGIFLEFSPPTFEIVAPSLQIRIFEDLMINPTNVSPYQMSDT